YGVYIDLQIDVYSKEVSVLMLGEDIPTFIAYPASAPCVSNNRNSSPNSILECETFDFCITSWFVLLRLTFSSCELISSSLPRFVMRILCIYIIRRNQTAKASLGLSKYVF
ncbi:uncharacterized protein LOC110230866, partial [Arabidopsis lyrata subsp. lyrata]|uniref:uncharacterized protein LOC110230866 n=1 Tax=Arabidopsis lyrata subsp. lyrata TaxID=81972 RepID=UPI000A29CC20